MTIHRREFLTTIAVLGGALPLLAGSPVMIKYGAPPARVIPPAPPDLVGVKDGSPPQMFEVGIAALGGMGRFVSKGQTVLVKPNIGWNKTPSEGATTNPLLVAKIVSLALAAGASKVWVFDHCCETEADCYKTSGIAEAVKNAKGEMLTGDDEKRYRKVAIPGGKVLKEALVHEAYLDADVIINVPILKSHGSTQMTGGLKNLMGVVWDRGFWHKNGLHECIADFCLFKRPHLNVIDAHIVMMKGGPRGVLSGNLSPKGMQILSTDIVLADTAAAKILDLKPEDITYLPMARDFGYGSMDLDKKNVRRLSCKA